MSTHKGIFKNSEIETISSKLKFISTLKKGQKISVSTNSIQDNTYWTSLMRSMTGENREKVYNFISDVIQDSLSILESLSNSNNEYDIKVCKNLITDLIYLTPGLQNLQETYKLDKMYVSKIMTLLQNLEVKIKELCDKRDIDYDEIFNETRIKMENDHQSDSTSKPDLPPVTEPEKSIEPKTQVDDCANCVHCNEEKKTTIETIVTDTIATETSTKIDNQINDSDERKKNIIDFVDKSSSLTPLHFSPTDEKKTLEKSEELLINEKIDADLAINNDLTFSSESDTRDPTDIEKDREAFRAKYLQSVPHDVLLMTTLDKNNQTTHEHILYNPQNQQNQLNRAGRKKKKKHAYQYDNYYMSTPDDIDDITLCNTELQKGIINYNCPDKISF